MVQVNFHSTVDDQLLEFAVIIAKYNQQYILCKHKERSTLEFPGGKREKKESILTCAKRELYEETGAIEFEIKPICIYSVKGKTRANLNGHQTYGMLYEANVKRLEDLPESEIEKIVFMDNFPTNWTYPEIQPFLLEKYLKK